MTTRPQVDLAQVLYPELSFAIVGAAIEVHKHLGPGQLESTYECALATELRFRSIPFQRQVPVEAYYRGEVMGEFVVDAIVDDRVVVELKAVDRFSPVHRAQLVSYLHATRMRLGMLINFRQALLVDGVVRIAL